MMGRMYGCRTALPVGIQLLVLQTCSCRAITLHLLSSPCNTEWQGLLLMIQFFPLLAVPFEEDEKDPSVWFLDHNYVESMNDMFKKVNAREKLIGWYHSGPKLRASDLEINELFKRYTPNPLLVIIDVQPKEVGVPTDAYFAVEEIKDVSTPHHRTPFQ